MEEMVTIEWSYRPRDYFEEPLDLTIGGHPIAIGDGMVTAVLQAWTVEGDGEFLNQLRSKVEHAFLFVQVMKHEKYELSGPSWWKERADGTKDLAVSVEPLEVKLGLGPIDVRTENSEGIVISDSKAVSIAKKRQLVERSAEYAGRDGVLEAMLRSYHAAVNDPENELTHLYEIRDALKEEFDGEKRARTAVGVSKAKWRQLGGLANNPLVRQGRHKGRSLGHSRKATQAELEEARTIAKHMILGYLEYLERTNGEAGS